MLKWSNLGFSFSPFYLHLSQFVFFYAFQNWVIIFINTIDLWNHYMIYLQFFSLHSIYVYEIIFQFIEFNYIFKICNLQDSRVFNIPPIMRVMEPWTSSTLTWFSINCLSCIASTLTFFSFSLQFVGFFNFIFLFEKLHSGILCYCCLIDKVSSFYVGLKKTRF
jgi:hypothetical protein